MTDISKSLIPSKTYGDRKNVYKILKQAGSGAFGTIYKAQHINATNRNYQTVALKLIAHDIYREEFKDFEANLAAKIEIEMLTKIRSSGSPYLDLLLNDTKIRDNLVMVFPWYDGMNLYERYYEKQKIPGADDQIKIFEQLAKGLDHLHGLNWMV